MGKGGGKGQSPTWECSRTRRAEGGAGEAHGGQGGKGDGANEHVCGGEGGRREAGEGHQTSTARKGNLRTTEGSRDVVSNLSSPVRPHATLFPSRPCLCRLQYAHGHVKPRRACRAAASFRMGDAQHAPTAGLSPALPWLSARAARALPSPPPSAERGLCICLVPTGPLARRRGFHLERLPVRESSV